MVGRGVLLNIPKMLGMEYPPDGTNVTDDLLDKARSISELRCGEATSCWFEPDRCRRC